MQVVQLIKDCWEQEPAARPSMAAVARRLRAIVAAVKARIRAEQQQADMVRRARPLW